MSELKKAYIVLMGGTIACSMTEDGGSTTVDIGDSIRGLHEFDGKAELIVDSFCRLGGYDTRISDILRIAGELERIIAEEKPDGIVVVMGTNVMEEISFALNLLVNTETPVVITGAMRIPEARGADGPANLIDAITVAISEQCRNMGVLVAFGGEIHAADYIRKEHTLNCNALTSDYRLGYIAEGRVSLRTKPIRRNLPWIKVKTDVKEVLLYTSYLGDTGELLDLIKDTDYQGIVIEGTGGGYTPAWITDKLERLHEKMPVVMSSRIGRGDTMSTTYGNDYGMPGYLTEHGYLNAGQLDGRKARILLTLLLMSECTKEQIAESFQMYAKEK